MINNLKKTLSSNLKNLPGWTTKRKIVVFSVDDYGNIRVASEKARHKLQLAGLEGINRTRFDRFDGLDTPDDLTVLFETLTSVKDKNGMPAIFTPYANCANIDFEAVIQNNFDHYRYELLPDTLNRLPGYEGAWQLWQEGIDNKLFVPQFHGREHLNIKLFDELLQSKDPMLLACIENNSYTGLPLHYYKTIFYNEAYSFNDFSENEVLAKLLGEGLLAFEKVFGYKASNFNAPGACEHEVLEKTMAAYGISYIDSVVLKNEHQGNGFYKNKLRYVGKTNQYNQRYLIRNCVFEPTQAKEAIASCLKEIETAFFWKKPVNISSHRVNFTGVIDEKNRAVGIKSLEKLLKVIVMRWPDVEFMAANELGDLMAKNEKS